MKISKKTIDILKNFASINTGLYVEAGNKLYTLSSGYSIITQATIDETFESNFAIYDLSKFLGVLSLFDGAELEFDSKYVTIYDQNNSSTKYYFCDPKNVEKIVKNYGKTPKCGKNLFKFDITSKQIESLKRAASLLELKTIKIQKSDQGGVDVIVLDQENVSPNEYSIHFSDADVLGDAEIFLNIDLLNLYPGNYTVEVGDDVSTKWTNRDTDLTYYIVKKAIKD